MQKENNFFFSFSSESKLTKWSKLLNYCRTCKKVAIKFGEFEKYLYLCTRFQDRSTLGEMVEWSITVVLKTTVPRGTGGSNPSLSAAKMSSPFGLLFFCVGRGGCLTTGRGFFQSLRFVKAAFGR